MKYFGIEIFDGIPQKQIHLDEKIELAKQWIFLTEDITCIDYSFNEFEFSIDVGWYPTAEVTNESFFKTIVIEGPITNGGVFFERRSKQIRDLKNDIHDAVILIQSFKQLETSEIINKVLF